MNNQKIVSHKTYEPYQQLKLALKNFFAILKLYKFGKSHDMIVKKLQNLGNRNRLEPGKKKIS